MMCGVLTGCSEIGTASRKACTLPRLARMVAVCHCVHTTISMRKFIRPSFFAEPEHTKPFRLGAWSRSQSGVTMIEVMVVVSIASILAAVAIPAFTSTLQSFRQRSAWGLLVDDMNRAKAEAIKRNVRVLLCARNAAGTDCAASASWIAGWLVCVEDSASTGRCLATSATAPNPIAIRPALNSSLTLTKTTSVTTDPIRFSANSTATAASLSMGGTWSGATTKVVSVAATGAITKQ